MIGEWAGWRVAFVVTALFGMVVLAAQVVLLPALPVRHAMTIRQLFAIVDVPRARVVLIASTFVAAGHFVAYTYLELFLREVPKFDQAMLGIALVTYAIGGILGGFFGELLAKRSARGAFVSVALLLGSSVLLAAAIGQSTLPALALVALWGLGFGAIPVCVMIWMYEAAPDLYEAGSAILVSVFQAALALGALLGGIIVDMRGVAAAFLVSGIVSIAGAASAALFDRRSDAAVSSSSRHERRSR
jgi:predicted MFS family arabinose efflux permease